LKNGILIKQKTQKHQNQMGIVIFTIINSQIMSSLNLTITTKDAMQILKVAQGAKEMQKEGTVFVGNMNNFH